MRGAKANERSRVLGEQLERLAELLDGANRIAGHHPGEPGAVVRVHRELAGVQTISRVRAFWKFT